MDKEHVFFENYAETWDRDRKENPEKLRFLMTMAHIQEGAAVLDVGCGTGVLLPYLREAAGPAGTVTALDYSRQMLDKARKKFGSLQGVAFVESDILKCLLPEQTYDVIICLNFYPHICEKRRDFIKKVRTLLKDGGSLVIMHDMGRHQVNSIYSDRKDSRPILPPVDMMSSILVGAGFSVAAALDGEDLYFIRVIKTQETPYVHYQDDDGEFGGNLFPAAGKASYRHSHGQQKVVLNRLARISGHLEAIKRMVEDQRDCSDILIQLAAVDSAIVSVGKVILMEHIDHCIADAVRENDMVFVEKLKKAIGTFVK